MNVRTWIEDKREQLIQDIGALVAIPSVSSPGEGGFPFGSGCRCVLDKTLTMAAEYGLQTENCEDYCGTAWLAGTGGQEIGIFSHLDVVPEGDGWTITQPYHPIVRDGWLYGRGSADNKGACVASMYALAYLKESGTVLNHTIRQFYGCDEERGMEDIAYYLRDHEAPEFSMVPDGAFPVCYGEKGRYRLKCGAEFSHRILCVSGGEGENSVPRHAKILLQGIVEGLSAADHISVTRKDGNTYVEASGLAAHASMPQRGISALYILSDYLLKSDCLRGRDREGMEYLHRLCRDFTGGSFGLAWEDEDSGELTMVASKLTWKEGKATLYLDIRYPVSADSERIMAGLERQFEDSVWDILSVQHSPAFVREKEDPAIKALTQISNRIQGAQLPPYCMSGGTYARKLPRAVGYGPGVWGQKKPCAEGHGYGHQPDECVSIDYLMDAVEIYVEAILTLDKLL